MTKRMIVMVAMVVLLGVPAASRAGVDLGLSAGPEGLRSFHLAVGEFFGAPQASVTAVSGRHMPDEDLPVVFFLAGKANVSPSAIVDLRLGGMSWMDISLRFGFRADVYHMDVRTGPPYGKAYGFYKKPKSQWKTMKLSDADVVNLVNLRFMSEHYGISPAEVMKMRDRGEGFVSINGKAKKSKGGGPKSSAKEQKGGKADKGNKGKGKNK